MRRYAHADKPALIRDRKDIVICVFLFCLRAEVTVKFAQTDFVSVSRIETKWTLDFLKRRNSQHRRLEPFLFPCRSVVRN